MGAWSSVFYNYNFNVIDPKHYMPAFGVFALVKNLILLTVVHHVLLLLPMCSKDCSMFWCVAGSHPYFSGGYITQVHGRDDFDAIQVETPRDLRIERGEEGRERFGHALGRAICDFYNFHYMNK